MKKIACFFQLFVLLIGLVHSNAYAETRNGDRKKRSVPTPGFPRAPRSRGGVAAPHPGAPSGAAPAPSSPSTSGGRPTTPGSGVPPRSPGGPATPTTPTPATPRGRPTAPTAPRGGAIPPVPRVPRGGDIPRRGGGSDVPRGGTRSVSRLTPGSVVGVGSTLPPAAITSGVAVASVNAGVLSGNTEMEVVPEE